MGHLLSAGLTFFYSDIQSAVDVNGHLSSFFLLSRGIRQGCPLSPLLYVLVAEVLACNIRANPQIHGILLPGSVSPLPVISQYIDDISLVVTSDDSIGRTDPPVSLDWSPTKLKILGVFLGIGDLEEANWHPRIDAVPNVLSFWRQCILSFWGRSLVINALALAHVWYIASLIHMPPWVLKELNSLVFDFFWKGKRELLPRSSVVQPSLLGGFTDINVKLKVWSLVIQWIKGFASSPSSWTSFMAFCFRSYLNLSPLEVFLDPHSVVIHDLPKFYQSLTLP